MLTNEKLISALKKSPWLQQAQRELEAERNERRQEYLRQIDESNEQFERTDAALVAKADPLERKLIALRAEVAALEARFEPLARDRVSAMCMNTEEVRLLRVKLRDEADECKELLRVIDNTRCEIASNVGGRRGFILHDDAAPSSRIASALSFLLNAYREVERIAVEEADLVGALDEVRREIASEGINLVSI